MSAPPYMKLYISDYHADTTELDVVGHGAYLLLLMAMWRSGGKLPRDEGKLSRLAKCTPEQWALIRDDIMGHFKVSGGVIRHSRVSKEIAKYEAVVDGSSRAGKASGFKRANKNKDMIPNVRSQNVERKSNQPEPEPERITVEDKSSTACPPNLDAEAWAKARSILVRQGGMTDKSAGSLFGRLLSQNGLEPRDMLASCATAEVIATKDPQGYLTKAAQAISKRRAPDIGYRDAGFV